MLVVTGLITVQAVIVGVRGTMGDPVHFEQGVSFPFGLSPLAGAFGVVAWLLLASWMARQNRAARADGYPQKYRPWVAWWGWVIPIWNLWAPYRFMKDAVQGLPVRHVGWWWGMYLAGTFAIVATGESHTVDGVTVSTTTLLSAPFNAVALTVSWFLLARIVWRASQEADGDEAERGLPEGPILEF